MARVKLPSSICDISERAFWSALQVSNDNGDVATAIRHGKAGRKAEAYQCLGRYHRAALAPELERYRRAVLGQPKAESGQTAEDLLRHRITTWHSSVAEFSAEIDWNYRATDQYGFHYLGWLSAGTRHLMETRDPAYRNCLIDIVLSYYRARNNLDHPMANVHLVYYELGAAAKTDVLLPLYLELLANEDLPTEAHEAFMKLFLGFARALHSFQTQYRSGNWQIAGCSSLFVLSRVFPEFKERDVWEECALGYLKEHLERDFYADGGHKERCCGYGYYSLSGCVNAFELAQRFGGVAKDAAFFKRQIQKGFKWFAQIAGPNDYMPSFGDSELFDGSGVLAKGQKYSVGGADRYQGVDRSQSSFLKPSGFAVMRNGDAADATCLHLSFGEFAGWHSHMDCLSLNLWSHGKPLIEEFGMIGGYGEALMIVARSPESHNQLTVDGMHYDNAAHPTKGDGNNLTGSAWEQHPDFAHRGGRDPIWHSTPDFDFFTAWHSAYRANWREPQAIDISVRRTIVLVKKAGYILVSDVAWETNSNNEGPNFSVTQNWHSPFPFKVTEKLTSARTAGAPGCLVTIAPQPFLRRLETGIDYTADEVTGHKPYNERYHLRARRWMPVEYRGATGITTVLQPFGDGVPAVKVETLELPGSPLFRAGAFAITTAHGRDVIALNPDHLAGVRFNDAAFTKRAIIHLGEGGAVQTVD